MREREQGWGRGGGSSGREGAAVEVATVLVARAVKPFIGWGGSRGYEPGSGAERSAMTEHFVFNLHLTYLDESTI